jgi:ABC-type multidrug transport system fused ATPase/permease subunit
MGDFWHFARRMFGQRALLALALLFATLSAGGFGVGLLGLLPVLRTILPAREGEPAQNLPTLAHDLAVRIEHATGGLVAVPLAWTQALPSSPFAAVVWMIAGLGALTVFGAAANFLHQYFSLTIVARTVAGIRRDAFRRAVHLPLRTVLTGLGGRPGASPASPTDTSAGPSDIVSRIVYDTASLGTGFNALLSKALAQATKGAAAMLVALMLDWRVALIALLVAVPMAVLLRKIGKRIRRASRKALESQSGLYLAAAESLQGLRVVKVHAAERFESGRFHRINKRVVAQEFRVRTARAVASPLIEVLTLFILGGFALVAAKAIIDDRLDPSTFFLVFAALGAGAASLKPIVGLLNDVQQSSAAANRLRQLLDAALEPGHDRHLPAAPALGPGATIAFERVTFTYPGAASPSLCDISISIPHGETVAFVGPNGCGKTTLLSLIPRLFDPDSDSPSARVLWNGRDIRELSIRSLRERIGVVTQETVLFRGTIGFNIAYGAGAVTEEQVRDVARRARAEDFILAKPGGYGFEVGEGGAGLSGGQRQRLAIARAILRDPDVLILDEATSMIDAESEAKISEAIAEFVGAGPANRASVHANGSGHALAGATGSALSQRARPRTCLIVAHRLSTVVAADRIVVMDGGRIVDQGTHDELLGRCPIYQSLVHNQLIRAASPTPTA